MKDLQNNDMYIWFVYQINSMFDHSKEKYLKWSKDVLSNLTKIELKSLFEY